MKTILFAALMIPALAFAQAPVCTQAQAIIDRYDRMIAYEEAIGLTDNSAPRETTRRLRIQNYISAIHANMDLLQHNKCPASVLVVPASGNESKYYSEALTCATDMMRGSSPATCKIMEWKGDTAKK